MSSQRHRPPSGGSELDARFAPAPAGTRVRWITGLSFAIPPVLVITNALLVPPEEGAAYTVAVLLPVLILGVIAVVWWGARIRCYRLTHDALVIERTWYRPTFLLEHLQRVEIEPSAPSWALKVMGNSGLGAMAGRFRNKRLGKFRAYLTDGEKAVVLRWPQQTVVVSPARAFEFVQAVRTRADITRASDPALSSGDGIQPATGARAPHA